MARAAATALFRPKRLLLLAAISTVAILGPRFASRLPRLSDSPQYAIDVEQIRLPAAGPWVPADIREQAAFVAGLPETLSLLDRKTCAEVGAAFAAHPWVAEVHEVRKSLHSGVEVDLRYREPALMIETRRGAYPVDTTGVLLPPRDFSQADLERFPVVRGIRSLPPGPAGERWDDIAVQGAVRLAQALVPEHDMDRFWHQFGLAAIVAPARTRADERPEDLVFELVTTGGSRIVWGHPPGADEVEPSVTQKLGRLTQYVQTYGSLDETGGPVRLDVRRWDVITRQPLAPQPR